MIVLTLGCDKHSDYIESLEQKTAKVCELIERQFQITVCPVNEEVGEIHYIKFHIMDNEEIINTFNEIKGMFYGYIGEVVYPFIANEYADMILNKDLKVDYKSLKWVKTEVLSVCKDVLTNPEYEDEVLQISGNYWRSDIMYKTIEYLSDNGVLIIEGFVRFRLWDMEDKTIQILNEVIFKKDMDNKRETFIDVSRFLISGVETEYELVELHIDENENIKVIDGISKEDLIESHYIDKVEEDDDDTLSEEDNILSLLMRLPPKTLSIYGLNNVKSTEIQAAVQTIVSIFEDRVKIVEE